MDKYLPKSADWENNIRRVSMGKVFWESIIILWGKNTTHEIAFMNVFLKKISNGKWPIKKVQRANGDVSFTKESMGKVSKVPLM